MPKYFIANWKAYLSPKQSLDLFHEISNIKYPRLVGGQAISNIKLIVCPSFIALSQINSIISAKDAVPASPASLREAGRAGWGSAIHLGAQDCFYKDRGAYTGEISAKDLKESGCEYVIIGHSERRNYLQESDDLINLKLQAVLAANLTPILCLSDTKEDRERGLADKKVLTQLQSALRNVKLKKKQKLLIAYEPVWALSSTKNFKHCDPEEALRMIALIKKELTGLNLPNVSVMYGGSVDETNIQEYLSEDEIGGVLVGSASTKIKPLLIMLQRPKIQD